MPMRKSFVAVFATFALIVAIGFAAVTLAASPTHAAPCASQPFGTTATCGR